MTDLKRKHDSQGILVYGFPNTGKTYLLNKLSEDMPAVTGFDTDSIVIPEGDYIAFDFSNFAFDYFKLLSRVQRFDIVFTNIYQLTDLYNFSNVLSILPHYEDLVDNRHVPHLGLMKILQWYDDVLNTIIDRGDFDTNSHIFLQKQQKMAEIFQFKRNMDGLYFRVSGEQMSRSSVAEIRRLFRNHYAKYFVDIVSLEQYRKFSNK